jgi:hypothetical protein
MEKELTAKEIKILLDASFKKDMHEKFSYFPETGQLFYGKTDKLAGALNKDGYLTVDFRGRTWGAHVLIYYLYYGQLPKGQIDHKNRIRSDNRIANLRDVSVSTNNKNKGVCYKSKSGVTGVTWNRSDCIWQAKITHKRKVVFIGQFKNLINAVKARHYAEQKFGYLNDGIVSSAQEYLNNVKNITFQTNIDFEEESIPKNETIASEWEFFCLKGMKKIDKLAEE